MRPVSAAFLEAVTVSHQVATRADLIVAGQLVAADLPVAGGSVTLDRTAAVRGRCTVTIADPTLIPSSALDPLTPFGAELQLFRGVDLAGTREVVSLGVFGIQDLTTDVSAAALEVTGLDRAQRVIDAAFEQTETIAAGVPITDAIQTLISNGVPNLRYQFIASDVTTPLLVYGPDGSTDRWSAVQTLAASIGCDLYFDANGVCVLGPVPDPSIDPPIAQLVDGAGGVVVSLTKKWDRGPAYNAVIGTSSGTETPISAVARDLDPTSPSYYYGPFGRKPLPYQAAFTSQDQAQTAVNAKLREGLGVAQSLDLSHVPNPALEPGDIVAVRRTQLDVDEIDVLDALTIPLDAAGTQTAGVRARQVTA